MIRSTLYVIGFGIKIWLIYFKPKISVVLILYTVIYVSYIILYSIIVIYKYLLIINIMEQFKTASYTNEEACINFVTPKYFFRLSKE